jgi:drug efflux transport system permease protein
MSLRKIRAIATKELRQSARDPLSLAMLLGLPALMLVLYGYAINFDVRHVALAVQDLDMSPESRELVASFVNSTYFDLVATPDAGADLARLTERREARAVLVVPETFSRDLAAGRTASVQFLVDGADANTASTLLGYAQAIVASANAELLAASPGAVQIVGPSIDYEPRVFYNPELRSTQFLVPGLMGFILMLTAVLSTALSVVREKERGTMEQLRVSSLHPGELIVGKTLPYLAISLFASAVIVVAARILFGVAVRGSYLDLFLVTLLYLVGALGFGLFVSSVAETQAMAFQVGMVVSLLPAILLSGFLFPIRSMPVVVQAVTYAVPARYYLFVVRGIMLRGAGLAPYARDLLFLALYGTIVMGIAYFRLTRREA